MVNWSEKTWDDMQQRHAATIVYLQSALKSLVLVNGGAVIALLTLLGNTSMPVGKRGLFWSFVWLGGGLASALFAHFPAYVSQMNYMTAAREKLSRKNKSAYDSHIKGDNAILLTLISLFVSLILFLSGSFVALFAIV